MIRYAAVASDGRKTRAADRETVDRWAKDKCAAGLDVEVYSTSIFRTSAKPNGSELVGKWMA